MSDLLQAAKDYLKVHEGVTPHTDAQNASAHELRKAIAKAEAENAVTIEKPLSTQEIVDANKAADDKSESDSTGGESGSIN